MNKRLLGIGAASALVLALAACGSSTKAGGILPAPSAGPTQASTVASVAPTTTTTTTAAKPTPPPKVPAALSKKPVVKPPSGSPPKQLMVKDLIKGSGKAAKTGSALTVNYVGVLFKGGQEFDSSWKTGKLFGPFPLGKGAVIPGWDQGLVGMKVGGRRELIIPSGLGYGKQGSPPKIGPNAALVFVIDLLAVS